MDSEYSELSYSLTKDISKADKKKDGIFFTPQKTIKESLEVLKPFMKNISSVLEPSCGSCEMITTLTQQYPEVTVTGIEKNDTIYDSIKDFSSDKITILNDDFISYTSQENYDLIFSNPPFFVMKKSDVGEEFHQYFDGRPNIFILFIIKALELLNPNGILCFVLPKNFLNCLYYSKTRKHIANNYKILSIFECDDKYIDTKQETIVITIQNKKPAKTTNNKFIIDFGEFITFGEPPTIKKIKALCKNSTTLSKLGFKVTVGNVVWNQCKSILTNDDNDTRLIYSSDIKDNNLTMVEYKNPDKKNYIKRDGITGPLLVVNRGYGVGNYSFDYCLIDVDYEYLIENHLICISYMSTISKDDLLCLYQKIITALSHEKTKKFITSYFGNNAINTTELNHILPLFI